MSNIGRITNKQHKQEGRKYRAPWYDTTRWRTMRTQHLQENPLCVQCEKEGRITPATTLDHIIPVSSVPEDRREEHFWNTPMQGLCDSCHAKKSRSESRAFNAHGRLITPTYEKE